MTKNDQFVLDQKRRLGFTLIELLVVIFCIVALALIIYRGIYTSIPRTEDARVVAEFGQLEKALAAYYSLYFVFPCGDNYDSAYGGTIDTTNDGNSFLQGNVNPPASPEYAAVVAHCPGVQFGLEKDKLISADVTKPIDHPHPGGNPWTYGYQVSLDRQQYILFTNLSGSQKLMSTDKGLCNLHYEIGVGVGSILPLTGHIGGNCN